MKSFVALMFASLFYLILFIFLHVCLSKTRKNVELDEMFYTYKFDKKNKKKLLENEGGRTMVINSCDSSSSSSY